MGYEGKRNDLLQRQRPLHCHKSCLSIAGIPGACQPAASHPPPEPPRLARQHIQNIWDAIPVRKRPGGGTSIQDPCRKPTPAHFSFQKTRIALSAAGEEVSSPIGSALPPLGSPRDKLLRLRGEVVKTPATVKDHTAFPAVVTLFFPSSSKCGVDAVAQGFIDHSRSATQILSRCGWVTFHDVRAVGVAMEGGHTRCYQF